MTHFYYYRIVFTILSLFAMLEFPQPAFASPALFPLAPSMKDGETTPDTKLMMRLAQNGMPDQKGTIARLEKLYKNIKKLLKTLRVRRESLQRQIAESQYDRQLVERLEKLTERERFLKKSLKEACDLIIKLGGSSECSKTN